MKLKEGRLAKRSLAITMSILMVVSMLPVMAFADEPEEPESLQVEVDGNSIIVNGEPAESPVGNSEQDYVSVSVSNGYKDSGEGEEIQPGSVVVNSGNIGSDENPLMALKSVTVGEGNSTVNAGEITSGSYGVFAESSAGGINTIATGSITADYNGVFTRTGEGGTNVVSAGDVNGTGSGLYANANGGTNRIEADDVNASNTGIEAVASSDGGNTINAGSIGAGKFGIKADAFPGGTNNIKAGDVCSTETGIKVTTYTGGMNTVTAGNVEAAKNQGVWIDNYGGNSIVTTGSIKSSENHGLDISDSNGGSDIVKVNGSIVSEEFYGLKVSNFGGNTDVGITGDVTGELGIKLQTGKTATSNIVVGGDVTGTGIEYESYGEIVSVPGYGIMERGSKKNNSSMSLADSEETNGQGKRNVLVAGTIAGDPENGVGVLTNDDGSMFKLTVWKIEPTVEGAPVGKGVVAAGYNGSNEEDEDFTTFENEEFEKKIQYIIKVDNPAAGATLTATRSNGDPLEVEQGWQWSYEGDNMVLLKVDLEDGYEIKAAYGDDGRSVVLVPDGNGNFYVNVPRGGGVYLSVELNKIEVPVIPVPKEDNTDEDTSVVFSDTPVPKENNTDGDEKTVSTTVNEDAPTIFSDTPILIGNTLMVTLNTTEMSEEQYTSRVVDLISQVPAGGTMLLNVTNAIFLNETIISALKTRSDVSVCINVRIMGFEYSIVIPAGFDLTKLMGANGRIDFAKLIEIFGTGAK